MLPRSLPRLVLFPLIAMVLAACGDSGGDASTTTAASAAAATTSVAPTTTTVAPAIDMAPAVFEFEYTFDLATETGEWIATGEAIDNGLLCARATSVGGEFEDENGNVRTFEELDALNQGSERFVSVDAEQMQCDDGSGDFTLRLINEVDPTNPDRHGIVATTWTVTGGTGYNDIHGSGDSSLPEFPATNMELTASGSITTK